MRLFAKDKNGHFIREVNGIKLPFPLTEFMKVRFVGYAFSAILMAISLFFIVTNAEICRNLLCSDSLSLH